MSYSSLIYYTYYLQNWLWFSKALTISNLIPRNDNSTHYVMFRLQSRRPARDQCFCGWKGYDKEEPMLKQANYCSPYNRPTGVKYQTVCDILIILYLLHVGGRLHSSVFLEDVVWLGHFGIVLVWARENCSYDQQLSKLIYQSRPCFPLSRLEQSSIQYLLFFYSLEPSG